MPIQKREANMKKGERLIHIQNTNNFFNETNLNLILETLHHLKQNSSRKDRKDETVHPKRKRLL